MYIADRALSPHECELLKTAIGQKLHTVDIVSLWGIESWGEQTWDPVRLHFDTGALDIDCELIPVPTDNKGNTEGWAVLSVEVGKDDILRMRDTPPETQVRAIDKTVCGVQVINEKVSIIENSSVQFSFECSQAVVFDLGDEYLVFDKEIWFSDFLYVKRGANLRGLIADDGANWVDDPEDPDKVHYEVTYKTLAI